MMFTPMNDGVLVRNLCMWHWHTSW